MNKDTFAFLKSRAIFTHGGAKTLHEALSHIENKRENNFRSRHPRKKAVKK